MFEDIVMTQTATIRSLQRRIAEMQPLSIGDSTLPTHPQLRRLFPHGGLPRGAATTVQGSLQLALTVISAASAAGVWCGAIGVPGLGIEAAQHLGIALERFVLIPEPGRHAFSITSTLSEVLGVIMLRTAQRLTSRDAERLTARLRDHSTALVVLGDWPHARSALQVTASSWSGLGCGLGELTERYLAVRSVDRRGTLQHTVRFVAGQLVAEPHLRSEVSAP